jgi:hypothetical protein
MRVRIAIAGAVIGTTAGITIGRTVRWWRTWGVDQREVAKPLPGDDLVPTPTAIDTRGIVVDAPPEAIWPWLVQMGYGRGGWYSYDQLDMLGKSADRILPDFQALKVGDMMPTSPTSGFAVKVVEPGRALVLYSDTEIVATELDKAKAAEPKGGTEIPAGLAATGAVLRTTPPDFAASWAFSLEPLDGGRTRLIERFRVRFGAAPPAFRVVAPMMGFGVFVMMQRQMRGILARAERTAVAPPVAIVAAPAAAVAPFKANGHSPERQAKTEPVVAPVG